MDVTYDTLNGDSLKTALTNITTDYLLSDGNLSIQATHLLVTEANKRPEQLVRETVERAVCDVLNAAKITVSRTRTGG